MFNKNIILNNYFNNYIKLRKCNNKYLYICKDKIIKINKEYILL